MDEGFRFSGDRTPSVAAFRRAVASGYYAANRFGGARSSPIPPPAERKR